MKNIKTYEQGDTLTIHIEGEEDNEQQVEVLHVSKWLHGTDLRVRTEDGEEFWTCAENILY